MNRADRQRWAGARTMGELGELIALWLEERIMSQPGYAANVGPAGETGPLVPVLAACNRAGFVTDSSQPGYWGDGTWEQRAAVEGFATPHTLGRILRETDGTGLIVTAQAASRWRVRYGQAHVVTRYYGMPYTRFGAQRPRRDIRSPHVGYGICHPAAVRALCGALQVTVIDPQWGRNTLLWPALERFAACGQGVPS
jgi:Domain of unknown function (DUF6919)